MVAYIITFFLLEGKLMVSGWVNFQMGQKTKNGTKWDRKTKT